MWGARVVLVAVLLVGACNGGGGASVDDTLPPPVDTTSTTAVDYSVPALIDAAYVEKVMAALDRVYGDAIRTLAAERQITEDFLTRLAAIYGDRFFRLAQDAWVKDVAAGLPDLKPNPGDPVTKVSTVVRAEPTCVVAAVTRDFGATRTAPRPSPNQHYIAFVPKPPGRDPRALNPTPWIMSYDGFTSSGAPPVEPCSGV